MGGGKWRRGSAKAKRVMLATIFYSVLFLAFKGGELHEASVQNICLFSIEREEGRFSVRSVFSRDSKTSSSYDWERREFLDAEAELAFV